MLLEWDDLFLALVMRVQVYYGKFANDRLYNVWCREGSEVQGSSEYFCGTFIIVSLVCFVQRLILLTVCLISLPFTRLFSPLPALLPSPLVFYFRSSYQPFLRSFVLSSFRFLFLLFLLFSSSSIFCQPRFS